MKTRSASTVRESHALRCFYSQELKKNLEVRVINETQNYTHVIVIDSNFSRDSCQVNLIAEASMRDRFVSVVLYGEARQKATSLKNDLKDLLKYGSNVTNILQHSL